MDLFGELAEFNAKTLKTGDKSVKCVFYAVLNEQYDIDLNELESCLKRPLKIRIEILDDQ